MPRVSSWPILDAIVAAVLLALLAYVACWLFGVLNFPEPVCVVVKVLAALAAIVLIIQGVMAQVGGSHGGTHGGDKGTRARR